MTTPGTGRDVWTSTTDLIEVLTRRLDDAGPTLARITADVERDWPDELGRLWAERAALVHRTLVHELAAAVDAARLVRTAMQESLAREDEGLLVVPSGTGRRAGGPRLGGTEAERVDDERGIRIAQLGEG